MSLSSILQDPTSFRIALLTLLAILVLVAYFAFRLRGRGPKVKSSPGPILLHLDQESPSLPSETTHDSKDHEAPAAPPEISTARLEVPVAQQEVPAAPPEIPIARLEIPAAPPEVPAGPLEVPAFHTPATRTTLFVDIMRGVLILLAVVVALGFALLIIPQGSVDRFSAYLQSRSTNEPFYEKIAFLYLGDEVRDDEFEISGAVRNITTEPIEQLDAVLRLYSASGELLETAVVRMDKDKIAPDEVAQFHLVYPHYDRRFGSYAVEFKLRQGGFVPYKDMRGTK